MRMAASLPFASLEFSFSLHFLRDARNFGRIDLVLVDTSRWLEPTPQKIDCRINRPDMYIRMDLWGVVIAHPPAFGCFRWEHKIKIITYFHFRFDIYRSFTHFKSYKLLYHKIATSPRAHPKSWVVVMKRPVACGGKPTRSHGTMISITINAHPPHLVFPSP